MPKSKSDFTNFVDARPNYFPGQFLLEDDFEIQHKYLADRLYYQNRSLHVSGIIEGLEVEVFKETREVQIKSGSAINSNGDLIILKNDTYFSEFASLTIGELYISYKEEKRLKQQESIEESFTRWQELPTIGFAATTPDDAVKLAIVFITDSNSSLDLTVRSYSGIFLPNADGSDLTLRSGGDANPNVAILNGSLTVTGTITGNIDATNINSGLLDIARLPNLSADKLTSGTLAVDRIPNLSANKITSGTTTGNLTIGGNLTVTGAITPSVGNSESNGIMFPKDPGGGSGDAAWIRYYSRNPNSTELTIKEQTTLEIGTSNDFNDHIALMPGAGNVGVGTITPTAKLEINGTLMNKMDLIETGQRFDWNSNTHPIKVYFKDRLTGKPVGTWIRAIQNHNSWRGHYWDGWVDADGAIRVIHNHNNTAATTANNSGAS